MNSVIVEKRFSHLVPLSAGPIPKGAKGGGFGRKTKGMCGDPSTSSGERLGKGNMGKISEQPGILT